MNLMTLLQVNEAVAHPETAINLFSVIMKGGWIMIPIFALSILAIFFMSDTWILVRKLSKVNERWFGRILNHIYENDIEQAIEVARKSDSALGKITVKGLQSYHLPKEVIEEDMQVEARQVLSKSEGAIGYLSLIATIAPMLGFLGTIFGVIKIFFNISVTNDLSISSISDGLYQKMICSGAGLLVGIIAYLGYYILNRYIDTILLTIDSGSNELLKAIASARRGDGKSIGR